MEGIRNSVFPKRVPQLWTGLLLIGLFWPLNWLLSGLRTSFLFFPLWLGYILVMDGLVYLRRGNSLLSRSPKEFGLLFVVSAPAWWLFEVINRRTQNWEYLGGEHFGPVQYFILATISFSTVMPAVFETAEWVRSFNWMDRLRAGPVIKGTRATCWIFLFIGLTMLTLTMIWPRYCYPLVWGSVVMILEPLNVWMGRQSFFEFLQRGDWRPVVSLSVGALICGFFWELWNYFSYPKWVYHTPGAEFFYIFEMPLLGYIGYLPFSWELYSLRALLWPSSSRLNL